MPWKWHTHLKQGSAKGEGERLEVTVEWAKRTREGLRCSLSTFELPSEGSGPLKEQYFFDEGLYSKWVCMQLYILMLKYLKKKKKKKTIKETENYSLFEVGVLQYSIQHA